jgi:hypothetical protein
MQYLEKSPSHLLIKGTSALQPGLVRAAQWARANWASCILIRHGIANDCAMRRYRAQVRFAQTNPMSLNTAYSQQP